MATVPSSHGSLDPDPDGGQEVVGQQSPSGEWEDPFDSDEFRDFLRTRRERQGRGVAGRRGRRGGGDESDEDRSTQRGSGAPPPEWDGQSQPFQDWLIKANLWLATTKSRPRTQGPMLLQRLSGQAFQSFKHWAKDPAWLADPDGGRKLLDAMNQPEYFGEDKEEELLSALAKLTYHVKRNKEESCKAFFVRWDDCVRKVAEHKVVLPDRYLGFLLINALQLGDQDVKSMMAFTRGSIVMSDVKGWMRKHEMKLNAKEVGSERKVGKSNQTMLLNNNPEDEDDADEDEILALQTALQDLQGEENVGEDQEDVDDEAIEEHEAAEILSTMIATQRKKTFVQSQKLKKAKELARGFGDWKNRGGGHGGAFRSNGPRQARPKSGNYRVKLDGNMTLEELKAVTRCGKCKQVGHWHKDPECPRNQGAGRAKEVNFVENEPIETEEAIFCGLLEGEEHLMGRMEPSSATQVSDVRPNVGSSEAEGPKSGVLPGVGPSGADVIDGSAVLFAYNDRDDHSDVDIGWISSPVGSCCDLLGTPESEILWSEAVGDSNGSPSPEDLCATVDTGCQRMAVGLETLKRLDAALPKGFQTGLVKQEHHFRSVHGRSTTSHAATVPGSLGPRGSLLKPAVFQDEASKNAPFLISLPFLMHCRAVLHLDPNEGLRIDFKRFGFITKCHLGPTGALRIPLGEFTKNQKHVLAKVQKEVATKHQEFEVLRTAAISKSSDQDCPRGERTHDEHRTYGDTCVEQEGQTGGVAGSRDPEPIGLDADRGEVTVHHGKGVQSAVPIDVAQTDQQGDTILSLANNVQEDRGNALRHRGVARGGRDGRGVNGKLPDGRKDDSRWRCGESDIEGVNRNVSEYQGRTLSHGGGLPDARDVTTVCPQLHGPSVDDQEARGELRTDLLAMPGTTREAVQILPVDGIPTSVERGTSPRKLHWRSEDANTNPGVRVIPDRIDDTTEFSGDQDTTTLSTSSNHEGREQCLCGQDEVPRVRQGDPRTTSRDLQPSPNCQRERGEQCGEVRQSGRNGQWQSTDESNDTGDSGLRGLQGVSELATKQTGSREEVGTDREQWLTELEQTAGELTKKSQRVVQQGIAALKQAEQYVQEIMNLVRIEPAEVETTGWQKFQTEAFDITSEQPLKSQKELKKYAELLGLTTDQLKVVAEIYNPKRFQGEARKQKLIPGEAFDLSLGHDLLNNRMRDEVRKYIKTVKPGLVIISPPCTLFSLLQNLNMNRRNPEALRKFLKDLMRAKVLLRFGVEIIEMVMSYGGFFVFENPLTSKVWQEKSVQKLIEEPSTILASGDQCMYGLLDIYGRRMKKPTGWITNSKIIAERLGKRCDGEHEHQQVIGNDEGGRRSKQAQIYSPELVSTILRAYREEIQIGSATVNIMNLDKLDGEVNYTTSWTRRIRTPIDDEAVKNELYAMDEPENMEDEEHENTEEEIRPLPREKPFSLEQLVKRAHAGLGHVNNEKLARILQQAKASPEAIHIAKNLKCAVCQAHQRVAAPRAAAPPRILHVNEIVGADTVWLPTVNGKQRMALNLVDWCSRFQMIIPLQRHTPGAARAAYLRWVRIFGPPTKLYVDLGKEFKGAFEIGAEYDSTVVEPSSLEMPTQRGITERAGRTFKEVLRKAMLYHACSTEGEWQELVDITNMTCNRLANKSGFSPVQRLLGYNPRIPGGLMTGGYNDWPTSGRAGEDLPMKHATEMRMAAARAFHEADCCQALRNSLHAGHRPVREFEVGQTVYFWRKGTDGPKKNGPQFWRGPARVIMMAPPTTIWLNFRGFIVKAAPEQLRHATEEEEFSLSHWLDGISQTRKELETTPRRGYLDLGEEIPIEDGDTRAEPVEARVPARRLHEKTEEKKVQFKRRKTEEEEKKDWWHYDPETGVLIRVHQVPRDKLFLPAEADEDCPVELRRLTGPRTSRMRDLVTGEIKIHHDEWDDFEKEEIEVKTWTGQTEFHVDRGDDSEQMPSPAEVPMPVSDEKKDEEPVGNSNKETVEMDHEDEDEANQRGETREREEGTGQPEEEEDRPSKRLRTEFLEIYMTTIERALAAKTKKEILFKNLPGDQRGVFWRAIEKEIKNNLETKAYQILTPEESESIRRTKPDKIIQSRYVLTEKNIEEEDVEKAKRERVLIKEDGENSTKAKARHVMKGFSEAEAETLETTTPQAGRESVLFGLQVICSYGWIPGYLDCTSLSFG